MLGNLRSHLHRGDGVDGAGGIHHSADVAALGLGGKVLRLVFAIDTESREQHHGDQDDGYNRPFVLQYVHEENGLSYGL